MNLTFRGFLRSYCRELTGLETDNLSKLCRAVAGDSPAAAEALMLFAAVLGKASYLVSLSKGTWLEKGYREVLPRLENPTCVEAFLQSEAAPQRYKKVWNAFAEKKEGVLADRRVSSLMRDRALEGILAKEISVYRLCEDLGLNKGNVYAYLNKGDCSKVSRATARKIMEYACG